MNGWMNFGPWPYLLTEESTILVKSSDGIHLASVGRQYSGDLSPVVQWRGYSVYAEDGWPDCLAWAPAPGHYGDFSSQPGPVGGIPLAPMLMPWLERNSPWSAALVRERDAFGKAKYGSGLRIQDGRDHWQDAEEEAGDLIQYVAAAMIEAPDDPRQHKILRHISAARLLAQRGMT